FDHAVALIERPVQLSTEPICAANNDDAATAHVVDAGSVPTSEGGWAQYSGTTAGAASTPDGLCPGNSVAMGPSVAKAEMYQAGNPATATCDAIDSNAQDAVFRFDVNAASAGSYDFDTIGSSASTALSVHRGSPDTYQATTTVPVARTVQTNNTLA